MKYGIVTVYRSENCGTFLQAFALSTALNQQGYSSALVSHRFGDHSASKRNYIKLILKCLLKGRVRAARKLTERRRNFSQAVRQLDFVEHSEKLNCYILGSDVIWDITSSYFRNHFCFFWGTQFKDSRVISYAPSVGFAKEAHFENATYVRDALKNMTAVSVRDQTSKHLLEKYCDKEIEVVCDPTYLIDRSTYDSIAHPIQLKKFIFLYCYNNLSIEEQYVIQSIAAQENLKTVTFGNFNSWCDIQLAYDPLVFLSIYDKADYIITNTFHGTVFATIYEKRFAVINNDKPKILDVLEMCAMSHKMTKTAEDISMILHSDFDYVTTRQNILREREKSMAYLKRVLEGSEADG